MAVKTAQVAVGTSSIELTGADAVPGDGSAITVEAAVDMFVGGSDLTAGNGFLVPANRAWSMDLDPGERLWAILASGSTTVYVLRSGV